MYYENEGTCTYMYFLPLKFSQYPSRPVPVPELFGKYPTRPVPKSKTPTRQTLPRGRIFQFIPTRGHSVCFPERECIGNYTPNSRVVLTVYNFNTLPLYKKEVDWWVSDGWAHRRYIKSSPNSFYPNAIHKIDFSITAMLCRWVFNFKIPGIDSFFIIINSDDFPKMF